MAKKKDEAWRDKDCGQCKLWERTDTENEINPSGKCNYLNDPYEGHGTHKYHRACSKFSER